MTSLVLGMLALALAGAVPGLLREMPRLRRTPRSAMLLWQSVALSAVLAALGATLALVTDQAWRSRPDVDAYAVAAFALAITLLVLGRLLLSGHRVGTNLRALRRRHREQVDLLATRTGGVSVLEHDVPVAYCLPGVAKSRVVVSAGAVWRLEEDELEAVLAHERAHLRARHDLVLEAFSVLHRAFPRWVSSRTALSEVQLLAEVLADGAAARTIGPKPLVRALLKLAEQRAPEAALGVTGSGLVARVQVLADDRAHRIQGALVWIAAVAVILLPTVFVAAPWLTSLVG